MMDNARLILVGRQIKELQNPFDRTKSRLNQSAHNGFELARLKMLRQIRAIDALDDAVEYRNQCQKQLEEAIPRLKDVLAY